MLHNFMDIPPGLTIANRAITVSNHFNDRRKDIDAIQIINGCTCRKIKLF